MKMATYLTIDDLRRLEMVVSLAPGGVPNDDLVVKLRNIIDNEYALHGLRVGIPITPAQEVQQMILDSPLGRVPDGHPYMNIQFAVTRQWLTNFVEAVKALG